MGRLVALLILAAGLPGILLGTGLAFLAFDPVANVPGLSGWDAQAVQGLAFVLIVLALGLAVTGTFARVRLPLGRQ